MVSRQRRGRNGRPDLVRSYAVDKIAGFFATQAVLAALLVRATSGAGQAVSVPMMDASLYYLWPDSLTDLTFVGEGVTPGTVFPLAMDLTECADGFITHLAIAPKERAGVARAIGRDDLNADPRFADQASAVRPENRRALAAAVAEGFRSLPANVALERLRAEDVPCAPIAEPADILADPHVTATGVLNEWDDPTAGRVRQPHYPAHFDDSAAVVSTGSPRLGAHGRAVLAEAGFDPVRIEALVADGVIAG